MNEGRKACPDCGSLRLNCCSVGMPQRADHDYWCACCNSGWDTSEVETVEHEPRPPTRGIAQYLARMDPAEVGRDA